MWLNVYRLRANSGHDDFELEFIKSSLRASDKKEITFSVTSTVRRDEKIDLFVEHFMFVPSHLFLVVMIAEKDTKSVSFLKLEPFIPMGLTNDFRLFDPS